VHQVDHLLEVCCSILLWGHWLCSHSTVFEIAGCVCHITFQLWLPSSIVHQQDSCLQHKNGRSFIAISGNVVSFDITSTQNLVLWGETGSAYASGCSHK